ncbi:MAG: hypothetical protein HUJ26_11060 [Planctomycetaceae bacterium]|nr:hypothetical protein [Planctomycetaceae bacterium]
MLNLENGCVFRLTDPQGESGKDTVSRQYLQLNESGSFAGMREIFFAWAAGSQSRAT